MGSQQIIGDAVVFQFKNSQAFNLVFTQFQLLKFNPWTLGLECVLFQTLRELYTVLVVLHVLRVLAVLGLMPR